MHADVQTETVSQEGRELLIVEAAASILVENELGITKFPKWKAMAIADELMKRARALESLDQEVLLNLKTLLTAERT